MKKLISIVMSIFLLTVSQAQTTTPTEMEKAENYFRNSSVVTFNEDYSSKDYIGSLIYYKPGEEKNLRILKITKPNDSTIVRTAIDDILYQKMHTREEVVSAKFLGIFNTKVTNKNLLEVILLRDYSLEAQSFLTDSIIFHKVLRFSKPLKNAGFIVEFIWKVNVNKLTSRVFKEGEIQVGFNYQVEGSGKIYNKTEDFTKKNLITLQTIDVSLFIPEATKSIFNAERTKSIDTGMKEIGFKTKKPRDYIVADKIVFDKPKE